MKSVTQLSTVLGLVLGAVVATANAGTVHAVAYETAKVKGPLTETGYSTGYVTRIILDEDYHDWSSRDVESFSLDAGQREQAEFAAFEESHNIPKDLDDID